MKVLVIGATGFIGNAVAIAFSNAGHDTYGQSRTSACEALLRRDEIFPLIGPPDEIAKHYAPGMDVIIDACRPGLFGVNTTAIYDAVLAACESRSPQHKLTYIFVSGTWTHGTPALYDPLMSISERAPLGVDQTPLIAWRADFETRVFGAATNEAIKGGAAINPIVVRPSLLYGRSGSVLAALFDQAYKGGHITWPGVPGVSRYNTIHQDDLARLILIIAEKAPIFSGLAIDAVNPQTESAEDVVRSLIRVAGGNLTYSFREPENDLERALCIPTHYSASLAYTLGGWTPRKPGLVDGMKRYYESFKGFQE
ncbi:NAD-P-binding protein [Myxozyma melibiosi]|uniref:NAD-P-binding protein n=1 Tax=Myxozyma melibiosi TaxID=54550 RepID=A0ABR1F1A4_9ASCO